VEASSEVFERLAVLYLVDLRYVLNRRVGGNCYGFDDGAEAAKLYVADLSPLTHHESFCVDLPESQTQRSREAAA